MKPTSSPLSPISPSANPSWESMDLLSETPNLDVMEIDLIVPDTPDYMLDSWWESDSVSTVVPDTLWSDLDLVSTVVPETPWTELDPVSTVVPETRCTELDLVSTVVPETPATNRRRKRPVEEEEWFKSLLVMLLPGMADLL